jgi:IS605 OrfB family transposase
MVESVQRAILLQTDATRRKSEILRKFSREAASLANLLLQHRRTRHLMDLHKQMYAECKATTCFNSQVICDVERAVVCTAGKNVRRITVKFNVPRNCKTFNTKSRLFVELSLYSRLRIAIPIRENRNLQRYTHLTETGWTSKTYGLTADGQIVAFLKKEEETEEEQTNSNSDFSRSVVGVDVNSKCFATSVLTPDGRVLNQLYFGKDIWVKRRRIMGRRQRLQSLADRGSHQAKRSIRLLKTRERNYVKNRISEVVRDITDLACRFDADIAVEKLRRFTPKGRKFNREVLRIPFYLFRRNLEARCFDRGIRLSVVDAFHTSKWCSHCGAVAPSGHSTNYALFRCPQCRQVVNSDRKASLAIAVKSLLVRNKSRHEETLNRSASFQFTNRPAPVNGLMRSNEEPGSHAVRPEPTPRESHLFQ